MSWVEIPIDIDKGMSTGSEVSDGPKLVQNMFWDKDKGLSKRLGLRQMPTAYDTNFHVDGNDIRPDMVFSTGKELIVRWQSSLWAWVDSVGQWKDRGPVSPFCGSSFEKFTGNISYHDGDVCVLEDEDLSVCVASGFRRVDGSDTWGVYYNVSSLSGDQTYIEEKISEQTESNIPWGPKVARDETGFVCIYATGTSAPLTLKVSQSTSANRLAAGSDLSTDVWFDSEGQTVYTCKLWDIISTPDGGYLIAWIDNTNQYIQLRKYNSARTLTVSRQFSADTFIRFAIADGTDNSRFFMLTCSATNGLVVQSLFYSNLATDDTESVTTSAADRVDNLSIVLGKNELDVLTICLSWVEEDLESSREIRQTQWKQAIESQIGSGTAFFIGLTVENSVPLADIFVKDGRFYQLLTIGPSNRSVSGQSANVVVNYEIWGGISEVSSARHRMVGQFNTGTAVRTRENLDILGSKWWTNLDYYACNLGNLASSEWTKDKLFTVCPEFSFYQDNPPVGSTEDDPPELYSLSLHVFDWAKIPQWISPYHGTLLIAGGMYTWYSGFESFELGFPMGCSGFVTEVAGSGIAFGTYQYYGFLSYVDTAGFEHRGFPCSHGSVTTTTGVPQIVGAATFDVTSKNREKTNHEMYVETTSLSPSKMNLPIEVYSNRNNSNFIASYTHTEGAYSLDEPGPLGYWVGGELENVPPNGGSIVAMGNSRVWTGGHFRPFKVQFSKQLGAAVATQNIRAPEFSDTFQRATPDRKGCTGIAVSDQTAYFFTETKVTYVSGEGPLPNADNDSFAAPPLEISVDDGCVAQNSVISGVDGVFFMGRSGMWLLTTAGQVVFVGEGPFDVLREYPDFRASFKLREGNVVGWCVCNEDLTDGRIVLFDYKRKAWHVWKLGVSFPVHACEHGGKLAVVTKDGRVGVQEEGLYEDFGSFPYEQIYEGPDAYIGGNVGKFRCRSVKYDIEAMDDCLIQMYSNGRTGGTISVKDGFEGAVRHSPGKGRFRTLSCGIKSSSGAGFKLTGIRYEVKRMRGGATVANERKA